MSNQQDSQESNENLDVKNSVLDRYSEGAKDVVPELCCPVDYDASLLKMLPKEIVDRDYGCGDPSRYVEDGDVVLDLGSGGGKICYMAAQLVGKSGKVIGVDMNDDMLGLARSAQTEMAEKLGADLVDFRKGDIQDLALNVAEMEDYLKANPINDVDSLHALEQWQHAQKSERPLVDDNSIDIVVSNCVLNLVGEKDRTHMINEIFRVVKPGGRVAISDIIADEFVPEHLKNDSELWSGCISGAFEEQEFLDAFIDAGFIAARYDKWDEQVWQEVEGYEFRSATVVAYKPLDSEEEKIEGLDLDRGQAVLYTGPFASVEDEYGRIYIRGEREAVSQESYDDLMNGAYGESFIGMTPKAEDIEESVFVLDDEVRFATDLKGAEHRLSGSVSGCCAPKEDKGNSCC